MIDYMIGAIARQVLGLVLAAVAIGFLIGWVVFK